ncbi:unnamed protein product [Brachionus calyciflorus]|uniref:Uncharacterized protein n=1 Tax=Brachionus calyciflorus TaxID=104777 RepID=A0A814FJY3_9BILA|nr:unnamed protein product [Brachionus calyciflorus]
MKGKDSRDQISNLDPIAAIEFPNTEKSRVSRIRGQVVETVSRIYNTENNCRIQRPTEQVNETLPIRLLSPANDTQQQRTELNVVTTENKINVNDSTIRTTPLESRTIRGNMRPNGAMRLIALESFLVNNFKIFTGRDGRWLSEIASARHGPIRSNLQRRPKKPKQRSRYVRRPIALYYHGE